MIDQDRAMKPRNIPNADTEEFIEPRVRTIFKIDPHFGVDTDQVNDTNKP